MGTKGSRDGLRTWIKVDRGAIRHNLGVFKRLISRRTKLMAVVKSNAYGHSLTDFSHEVEHFGADWLGVDSIVEALALRRDGVKLPILVLGYTFPERFREAAEHSISITVSTFENLKAALNVKFNLKQPLKIHIKADTGMHRQGFLTQDLKKVLSKFSIFNFQFSKVRIEGLYTHFAAAKNPAFPEHTKRQLAEFEEWRSAFKKADINVSCHAAATAGAMLFPESHYDMVRIGIGLYGLWPDPETRAYAGERIRLKPALSWKSIVSEVKKVQKGKRIGYGLTEELPRDSTLAVVPIGYWHGYPRFLSSVGRMIVHGKRVKVIGRVSMDMTIVDVTDVQGVKPGDEAVVVGTQDRESITIDGDLSGLSDSSYNYEFVTRINPLIKRIYI